MLIHYLLFSKKDSSTYGYALLLLLSVLGCKQTKDSEENMGINNHEQIASEQQTLTEENREIMTDFADIFYGQKDVVKAFEKYVSEEYIQHNPNILDGQQAAVDALKLMFENPDTRFDVKRILVDGDLAMIHLHAKKDSTALGGAVADLYRIKDGKIVEHWDIMQPIPANAINSHPMFEKTVK